MKKTLLLLLVILSISTNAQKKKRATFKTLVLQTDSLKNENLKIKEHFNTISMKLDKVLEKNNDLEKELLHFRVKEDYYKTAVAEQTKYYMLTVSIAFLLVGLLSWGVFKLEVKSFKKKTIKKVEKLSEKFKEKTKKFDDMEMRLLKSMSNLNVVISDNFDKTKEYSGALLYMLKAASESLEYEDKYDYFKNPEEESQYYFLIQDCLNLANKLFNSEENYHKINFKKDQQKIEELLLIINHNQLVKTKETVNNLIKKIDEIKLKFNV